MLKEFFAVYCEKVQQFDTSAFYDLGDAGFVFSKLGLLVCSMALASVDGL